MIWGILLHSAGCCSLPTGHSFFLVPHAEPRTEHASFVEADCAGITAPFEAFSVAEPPFLERAEHAARHRAVVEGSRLQWLGHEARLAEKVRLEGVQLDGIWWEVCGLWERGLTACVWWTRDLLLAGALPSFELWRGTEVWLGT